MIEQSTGCIRRWRMGFSTRAGLTLSVISFAAFVGSGFTTLPSKPSSTSPDENLVRLASVIGKDERRRLPKKYAKFGGSVGLLVKRSSSPKEQPYMCTAFCVADTVIATNAHCLVRKNGRRLKDLDKLTFIRRPDIRKGLRQLMRTRSRLVVAAPDDPYLTFYTGFARGRKFLAAAKHDWAFAQLRRPICAGHALSFASPGAKQLRRAARRGSIFMIGFHGDLDPFKGPYYSPNCRVRPRGDGQSMNHYCDMTTGSSGSPILWLDKGKAKVVGINVGHYAWRKTRYWVNRKTGKRIGRAQTVSKGQFNLATRPENFLKGVEAFANRILLKNKAEFLDYQTRLKETGYYKGKVDGLYGPATRSATKKFEKSLDLIPLGLPSKRLLHELRAQTVQPLGDQPPRESRVPGHERVVR